MKIAVFASGNGSNFKNLVELSLIKYLKAEISLLVTDRDCNAIKIANDFNIKTINTNNQDKILSELNNEKIDFIVLAGYLSKISENIINSFKGRIVNIHPALLPSFGGKGFYGSKVHEKVMSNQVKITGITIHFVNEEYDKGPIIFQKAINILPDDNIKSIQDKIHKLEYFYYPFVLTMIFDGIIELKNNTVVFNLEKTNTSKHALISVTDKENIIDVAKKLNEKGYLIISTGGSFKILKENNVKVLSIDSITGFDEILDGRVKTLNNSIFGGILALIDKKSHIKNLNELFIPTISVVIVNLYDFDNASKKYNSFEDKLMENIDIGGVSLIRAAAKNFKNVLIVCDKTDYDRLIKELDNPSIEFRKELAQKAFQYTAKYDAQIASKLSNENFISIQINKVFDLRYGENPHQKASFYSKNKKLPFEQLSGKELSYNNILDAYGSWQAVCDFEKPACVIFKHVTPCGIAIDEDINKAFEKAYNADPLSAFGGIIAINRTITKKIAEFLSNKFIEIISAPNFETEAIEILKKKKNLRLLKWNKNINFCDVLKGVGDEIIIMEPDKTILADKWEVVNGEITDEEKNALIFAFTCVKHIKSNAIVITSNDTTLGIGSGQMSRIDAVNMAAYKFSKYLENNPKPNLIVMASDAFFPFEDSIIKAKEIGVSAIIQPGGSIRDKEVIEKAKELNIKMVLTGVRHFRH